LTVRSEKATAEDCLLSTVILAPLTFSNVLTRKYRNFHTGNSIQLMNPIIIEHFDTYEVKLIESPAIVSYQIRKNLIKTLIDVTNAILEF